MRTPEEIARQFEERGFVHLSEEESAMIDVKNSVTVGHEAISLSFAKTVSNGDKKVVTTASATLPSEAVGVEDFLGLFALLSQVIKDDQSREA